MDIATVYATTAANPNEVSYGCYYDSVLETYLGDVYSVKWMQNIDKASFEIINCSVIICVSTEWYSRDFKETI